MGDERMQEVHVLLENLGRAKVQFNDVHQRERERERERERQRERYREK